MENRGAEVRAAQNAVSRLRTSLVAKVAWRRSLGRHRGLVVLLLLGGLSGASIAFPSLRPASLQLMYLPILFAAITWGPFSALGVGVVAAMAALVPVPTVASGSWPVQAALFIGFAAASAWVLRSRRRPTPGMPARSSEAKSANIGRERILESLARTVEVRDNHTQGHCRRVAKNALILGRELNLSAGELDVLYWAALLHDIGKIAVPEYILLKNGRLSEDEFAEIRRHPAYGADLLASVSQSFRSIADVVRAHHERWDGLGYPLGYRDSEIPRLARIIAIVDVFEALTSMRPYRSPMPLGQALSYVRNGAGTQFDPDIVPVFEALVDAGQIESGVLSSNPSSRSQVHAEAIAHITP